MKKTTFLERARQRGKCPDRYYYQLNGKSAQQNYAEQKKKKTNDAKEDSETRQHVDEVVKQQVDRMAEKILKEIMR